MLAQPVPADLVRNVVRAAFDVHPRMAFDPRAAVRYWTTLTSRLVKLQGGLVLRAVLTADEVDDDPHATERPNVRSTA